MSRAVSGRAVLVWLHRWVGLTVGLLFTVACLSGTALYFQPQYWEWAYGDLTPPGIEPTPARLDQWIANSRAAVPDLGRPIALWPPYVEHNVSDAGMVIFGGREPHGFGRTGFVAVLVEPPTGRVLGVVDVDTSPAYAPLFFHRNFWGGAVGSLVVGVMAVGSLFMLIAGLYLWWPAAARVGRKLSGRPWRISLTRARPMHDWVGVWTFPILLLLTFTGLYIAQPTWIQPAIAVLGPPQAEPPTLPCGDPMSLDIAVTRAAALAGASTFRSIYPGQRETAWEITFSGAGSEALHRETHVVADLACGTVVVEASPTTRASSEAAQLWIYGLHDGSALGAVGPELVTLVGLGPLVLMISGIRLWLRGRRATATARVRSTLAQAGTTRASAELSTPS